MGDVIGVMSLKGGVGKTSSVVELGAAMAKFGKRVLLVDANFSAPNLGMHLNLDNPEKTIQDVLNRKVNPTQAVHSLGNFDVIPARLFNKFKVSHLNLKNKLKYLKQKYDYILLDSAPSLDEDALAVMLAADYLIVVTTPDYPTLATTLKEIRLAKQRGVEIGGLVVNKVYNKNFEMPVEKIEEAIETPVLAVIPQNVGVVKSLAKFVPHVENKPNSETSEEFKKLAAALIGEKYKPIKLKRFFRWVAPKKQDINRLVFYESVFK